MRVTSLILGFLVFGFLITGMTSFYGDLFHTYDTPNSFNISVDVSDERDQTYTDIRDVGENSTDYGSDPDDPYDNPLSSGIIGTFTKGISTLFNFPGQIAGAVESIVKGVGGIQNFNIPDWVSTMISAVVWVMLTAMALKILFKVKV